jgi:hypothetical protein
MSGIPIAISKNRFARRLSQVHNERLMCHPPGDQFRANPLPDPLVAEQKKPEASACRSPEKARAAVVGSLRF